MGKKQKTAGVEQKIFDEIEYIFKNANQKESHLFIGNAYTMVLDMVHKKLCPVKPIYFYEIPSGLKSFMDFCNQYLDVFIEEHIVMLHLKSKNRDVQEWLNMIVEEMQIPIMLFVDDDVLMDSLMSRFKVIHKSPNEIFKEVKFTPPHTVLARKGAKFPYDCPSLIKLGDFEKLLPSEIKMDITISKLSGNDSLYPEVLSTLPLPAKEVPYDIKLEALSWLKNRRTA